MAFFERRSMIFDRQGHQPKVVFWPGECDVIGYSSVVWTWDFIAITKKNAMLMHNVYNIDPGKPAAEVSQT